MTAAQIAQAIEKGELKTLQSIAKHLPRQSGDKGIGVNSATAFQWIERGNLPLEEVLIDTQRFFYVSADDQRKPDWNLQVKFNKRDKPGRKSTAELLGFAPKKS